LNFIKSLVKLFFCFYAVAIIFSYDIILGSGKYWSGLEDLVIYFLVVPLFVDTGKEGP